MALTSKAKKAGKATARPGSPRPNLSWALHAGEAEEVLRALPELGGHEDALQGHLAQAQALPSLSWRMGTQVFGFVTWKRIDPSTAQLCCLAVKPQFRRQRVASMLLGYALSGLHSDGVRQMRASPSECLGAADEKAAVASFLAERGFQPQGEPEPQTQDAGGEDRLWTKRWGG